MIEKDARVKSIVKRVDFVVLSGVACDRKCEDAAENHCGEERGDDENPDRAQIDSNFHLAAGYLRNDRRRSIELRVILKDYGDRVVSRRHVSH